MTKTKMNEQHEYLEKYLNILYENPKYLECEFELPGVIPRESFHYLVHFYTVDVTLLTPMNDCFCGINFSDIVIEKGYYHDEQHPMYIVTGNHKGHRNIIILKDGWEYEKRN